MRLMSEVIVKPIEQAIEKAANTIVKSIEENNAESYDDSFVVKSDEEERGR